MPTAVETTAWNDSYVANSADDFLNGKDQYDSWISLSNKGSTVVTPTTLAYDDMTTAVAGSSELITNPFGTTSGYDQTTSTSTEDDFVDRAAGISDHFDSSSRQTQDIGGYTNPFGSERSELDTSLNRYDDSSVTPGDIFNASGGSNLATANYQYTAPGFSQTTASSDIVFGGRSSDLGQNGIIDLESDSGHDTTSSWSLLQGPDAIGGNTATDVFQASSLLIGSTGSTANYTQDWSSDATTWSSGPGFSQETTVHREIDLTRSVSYGSPPALTGQEG